MALFNQKKCPNCGQPQEKNWDKCPFCAQMGGMMGGGGGGGGMTAPPQQQFSAQPPVGGGGSPQKTVAFMVGAGGQAGQLLGWIVPLKGPHRAELFTLKPAQTVIGKEQPADIVFNDPFMSGRHATIRAQNGVYILEDHSTNGTWVNDKKIKTHELVDNDFIKFGQTIVKFKSL